MKKKQPNKVHPFANIPPAKLKALLGASDQMMRSILLEDRQKTLDTVTRQIKRILKAESCAIFLVPDSPRDVMFLESSYTDKDKAIHSNISIKIQSLKAKGLTGHIADKGEIVNLSFTEIQASEYWANTPPEHLKSETCLSLLGIPLKDRKGRLLGLLKTENKKGSDGLSNKNTRFTIVDEFIARVLANKVVIVLENLRTHDALQGLIQDAQVEGNHSLILEKILQRAVSFMRADRGDLALWSEEKRDLIIASVWGETVDNGPKPGDSVPTPSIVRSAWNETPRRPLVFSRNIGKQKVYYERNPRTLSEAAILLNLEGRTIGVLNLESFYLDGFDKKDLESLLLLSNCVSIAVRMASKHRTFHQTPLHAISDIPPEFSADWSDTKCQRLIFAAIQAGGFERARIYKYDGDKKLFTCMGSSEKGAVDTLRGKSSGIETNPYARDMAETYLSNKHARIYDPTDPLSFGKDPSADAVGKPTDMPWAAAPLIVEGELCGQITADNKSSRKKITEESLEYLNLIAVHISRSLTQSRASQLATLMKTIPDHIYFKDRESRFLRISDSLAKAFGLKDPKEAVGKTDFDFFREEDARKKFDDEQGIIATDKPVMHDEEPDIFKNGDNRERWVSTIKVALKTDTGNTIGTCGISRNVTHRRDNRLAKEQLYGELSVKQKELEKAKARLDKQMESASKLTHFGFWEWDIYAEENFQFKATDEVYRIFRLRPQQAGVTFSYLRQLVHPEDRHIWDTTFSLTKLSPNSIPPSKIRLQFLDGSIKHLYAKSEVDQTDDAGLPTTIIGLVQDVTELKEEEMRAEGLELAVRGFQHMIPGKADESLSGLKPGDFDNGSSLTASTAVAKAIYFIFMIRHKAYEIQSLRSGKSEFKSYSLGEIWMNAWPIALDLARITRYGLNIAYGVEINDETYVNGAFYTAAVNILSNMRKFGTAPVVVWAFIENSRLTAIFADGGPKLKDVKKDTDRQKRGVGLPLVGRVLEIIKGSVQELTWDELCDRYTDLPEDIKNCKTFYRVEIPM